MRVLLAALFSLLSCVCFPSSTHADWLCEGDRLTIEVTPSAVDISGLVGGIPNMASGTVPGDGVLLKWRDLTLQLPRTNNAGTPSYTDGRWWWRAEDPDHPEFKLRRDSVMSYRCEPIG